MGVIISFIQSLLGNAIVFIFPSIFYLKMLKKQTREMENVKFHHKTKVFFVTVLCYFVVVFGVISVFGGCIASIMFWSGYLQ